MNIKENMQVVILAGGMGTRMKPVAGNLPKALVPVAGRPFIDHQLELLRKNNIKNVLLCIGYQGDMIEKHVGNGNSFGLKVDYSRESPDQLLGTGGALVNALPFLQEKFMVIYGDSYLPTDYQKVVQSFDNSHTSALMCVYHNQNKWDQSNVKIEGNSVVFYSKKPGSENLEYIDYGLSVYKKSVIEQYLNKGLPLDLADIQEKLVINRQLNAYIVKERFYEIGKPSGLAELEEYLGNPNRK